jgi:DNA topoisomerase-3
MDTAVIKFVPDDKKDLERTLKEEARKASALICFLDGDREGENISFEVIETCRTANPRIQVKRAHFSAVIQQEIDRAMRTLVAPDKNLSDAVDARIEIDLRLGAAFTRFQTLTFAKQFGQLENKLLSWGPCQFATLGFIVDRDWKIERFVQEDFWSVTLKLKADDGSGTAVFEWERGRLFDQTLCASLYEEMLESPEAIVTNVREHIKRKWKPKPLATVELQTLASRKVLSLRALLVQKAQKLTQKRYAASCGCPLSARWR